MVAAVDLARVRRPLQGEQEQKEEEVDFLMATCKTTVKAQPGLLLTSQPVQVSQDLRVKLVLELKFSQSSEWLVLGGSLLAVAGATKCWRELCWFL